MNLQAISSAVHTAMLPETQNAAPAAVASSSSAPLPKDTVSLSPAAQAAPSLGNVDHDGDSH